MEVALACFKREADIQRRAAASRKRGFAWMRLLPMNSLAC
jgi:hypothetical protein